MYKGQWHSTEHIFGLHYDLHAGSGDTELGLHTSPEELTPMLELIGADFVQTDCKGHPGYTSWFSQTPGASVPPGLQVDALLGWREATRRLGLPLHCHYSGTWDMAAGALHPEWTQVGADGQPTGAPFGGNVGAKTPERMCPRSDYDDHLMIPQLLELIDRYGVDGFWIDGDLWAGEPCYCRRCREEFTRRTGILEPPQAQGEVDWPAWISFSLDSFYEHVTRVCDAVHEHKPGVLVCSNWLQTFRNPGAPVAPTDWVSGDNSWVWGLDGSRCEARFISTRGKPWDIMLWSFYSSHGMGQPDSPWTFKPVQMLQQEAAVTLALGGSLQVYETTGLRSGQLVAWRLKKLSELGAFVKARGDLCRDTQTIAQVAVLHSEAHVRAHMGSNLMWGVDTAAVQGAVFSLLENHYNIDILDEWALLPRLAEFAAVVVPEQEDLSAEVAAALQDYAVGGGKLLVSGAGALARFGAAFLGVGEVEMLEKGVYFAPAGDGAAPVYSERWGKVQVSRAEAQGQLGRTDLRDERLLGAPAWTLNQVGQGAVAWVPFDLFRSFDKNRYPGVRQFVGEVAGKLIGRLPVRVSAPTGVDAILRQKGGRRLVHLINRLSGLPNVPSSGAVDEIPAVGPLAVEMDLAQAPLEVSLAFEEAPLTWEYQAGVLRIQVERVHIHCAIVVDCA